MTKYQQEAFIKYATERGFTVTPGKSAGGNVVDVEYKGIGYRFWTYDEAVKFIFRKKP